MGKCGWGVGGAGEGSSKLWKVPSVEIADIPGRKPIFFFSKAISKTLGRTEMKGEKHLNEVPHFKVLFSVIWG